MTEIRPKARATRCRRRRRRALGRDARARVRRLHARVRATAMREGSAESASTGAATLVLDVSETLQAAQLQAQLA